jgi:hypothetical protein
MALTDNLIAFYKLSDISDSSGNNRTLINNGNVTFASGKIGNAAVFDGTNSLSVAPFNIGTSFTFGCWVNSPQLNNYDIILMQFAGAGFYTLADGNIQFGDISSWNASSSSPVLTTNTWQHIVLVSNAGSGTLFVDGVVVASDSSNILDLNDTGDRPFGINGDPISGASSVARQIDAVGVWSRALSSAEVAELYNNGTGLELDPPNYRGEWDNFTNYGQDDVVSVNGVYWKLTGLGGWTVGGAPGLGYGWTLLGFIPSAVRISGNAKLQGKVKFA